MFEKLKNLFKNKEVESFEKYELPAMGKGSEGDKDVK